MGVGLGDHGHAAVGGVGGGDVDEVGVGAGRPQRRGQPRRAVAVDPQGSVQRFLERDRGGAVDHRVDLAEVLFRPRRQALVAEVAGDRHDFPLRQHPLDRRGGRRAEGVAGEHLVDQAAMSVATVPRAQQDQQANVLVPVSSVFSTALPTNPEAPVTQARSSGRAGPRCRQARASRSLP